MLLDIAPRKDRPQDQDGEEAGPFAGTGGKGATNAAVDTLRAVLSFGIRRGVRPDNPAKGVLKFPEKKLERFLSPAELARLGEALTAAEALRVESRSGF